MTNKINTANVLTAMHVLAWVTFIGLLIQAGAMLVSYGVSCFRPEGARNLYLGLNLYELRHFSFWHYTQAVSLIVAIPVLKAWMVYLVIRILSRVNLETPFTEEVAGLLEKVSYVLFGIWAVMMIGRLHAHILLKLTGQHFGAEIWQEYLFVAGLVFIISQVFRRGVEIQSENTLTV